MRPTRPRDDARKSRDPEPTGPPRVFHLVPGPKNASVRVDDGAPQQVTMGALDVSVPPGAHTLVVFHPLCFDERIPIAPADEPRTVQVHLRFKPARLVARCPAASIITVDGKPVDSGMSVPLSFDLESTRTVKVEFSVAGATQSRDVPVTAAGSFEATCDGR